MYVRGCGWQADSTVCVCVCVRVRDAVADRRGQWHYTMTVEASEMERQVTVINFATE